MDTRKAELIFRERGKVGDHQDPYILQAEIVLEENRISSGPYMLVTKPEFPKYVAKSLAIRARESSISEMVLYRGQSELDRFHWQNPGFIDVLLSELRSRSVGLRIIDSERPSGGQDAS